METGIGLTWAQCQPPAASFPQNVPIFDPNLSPSYQCLVNDDPLCDHPYLSEEDKCVYRITYGDGLKAFGVFSRETLFSVLDYRTNRVLHIGIQ